MTAIRRTHRGEDLRLLVAFAGIASEAGARIIEIAEKNLAPRSKADCSPVTAADEAAEEVIAAGLQGILPGCPVIAEEAAARGAHFADDDSFVLVDPIDGTKELIAGRGEYTVNIALVENRRPVLGVLYAPGLNLLYAGSALGAFRQEVSPGAAFDPQRASRLHARPRPAALVAMVSRSHPDDATARFLARHEIAQTIPLGSSLKFARLAEGAADLYPRLAALSQWDIAAGDALLTAAGGSVTAPDGTPFRYGRNANGFAVPAFIAWGAPAL